MWYVINSNELYHHGIKGQKWGVRRFQNEDGSVTASGAERYYVNGKKSMGDKGGATEKKQKTDNGRSLVSEKTSKFLYDNEAFSSSQSKKIDKAIADNLSDDVRKNLKNKKDAIKKTTKAGKIQTIRTM